MDEKNPVETLAEVTTGNATMTPLTRQDYEEAVVYVYDKAATSEDWMILRSAKQAAGNLWLAVCVTATEQLRLGRTINEAFGIAMGVWGIKAGPN